MLVYTCFFLGFATLISGVALYSLPAALIVAGTILIFLSIILSIGGD